MRKQNRIGISLLYFRIFGEIVRNEHKLYMSIVNMTTCIYIVMTDFQFEFPIRDFVFESVCVCLYNAQGTNHRFNYNIDLKSQAHETFEARKYTIFFRKLHDKHGRLFICLVFHSSVPSLARFLCVIFLFSLHIGRTFQTV